MNEGTKVFEAVFIMIFPKEIFLFFGNLQIIELKMNGIEVKLTTTVAGCITGVIAFLLLSFL